ncbi:MAG: hypothetical protein RL213_306, partial [Bacteroidota bacterium]
GTYTVTATDANGCTLSASAVISQPAAVSATVTPTAVSCNGGSNGAASVNASGGTGALTYSWSPTGGSTANASGLAAGNYTVTVTDANGCSTTATTSVTQPAALQLSTSTIDATCGAANGSASVAVTGGGSSYTFSWSPGGATSANLSNISAGSYTVTVTDNAGCTSTAAIVVSNFGAPALSVTSSSPTSCHGGADGSAAINAAGGSPPFTYSWSPSGGTGTSASGLSAGNYQVAVTDINGCVSYVNVTIAEPAAIQIQSTSVAAICTSANGSASIIAGGGNGTYSYSWSPSGGSGATATGLSSGSYSVTVTDANGCSQTAAVTVPNAGGGTTALQVVNNVSCNGGNDGSLTANMTGGTAPFQYAWLPSGGNTSNISGLSAGSYSVTVTDANGCIATAQTAILEPGAILVSTSTTPAACNGGTNGTATATVSGGTGSYTYQWTPSGGSGATANGLSQGVYNVTVTDANGCTLSTTAVVNNTANINVNLSTSDVSCFGGNNGTATMSANGGSPPYTYLWSPSGGTGTSAVGLSSGQYQITVTDMMGCSHTELLAINEPAQLSAVTTGSDTLCINQSADVSVTATGGTAPYAYVWSNGSNAASQTVSPTGSTTYDVTVTDANGCVTTGATVDVEVLPPLQAYATGSDTLCPDQPFNVAAFANGGDGNYTYSWSNSTFTGTSFTATPLQDSTVSVTVTDGCGQSVTDQVNLIVSPGPLVNFTPFSIIDCAPVTVQFNDLTNAPAGSSYSWNFGDQQTSNQTEPVHTYTRPGIYSVSLTVTSQNGCSDQYMIPGLVDVSPAPQAGFVSSATELSSIESLVQFTNTSTGAVVYNWSFGDGSSAFNVLNPSHQYSDTGTYEIQLAVMSPSGCVDTVVSYVHVTEGFSVFIPNAFTPNGDDVNDFFAVYGVGFDDYDMYIIDRWGLLIFHSTDPKIGWNGTVGGDGVVPCQNDVYEFIVRLRDSKGERHRYIGHVTLVR